MRKRFLTLIIALLMIIGITVPVNANSQGAYSLGMKYKNETLDTSGDATNAASDFGLAGYSSYYNITPTYNYVKNRIGNEIFFFSGHGTIGRIYFNAENTTSPFHVTSNFVQPSTSPRSVVLRDSDLSSTKLMTFGACQSANYGDDGSGNYRPSVLSGAINGGAKTAVGWKESIGVSAHSLWLLRYTNQLAVGDSVQEAVDYANMWNYTDSAVKTSVKIYGDKNLVIKQNGNKSSLAKNYMLVMDVSKNNKIKGVKFNAAFAETIDVDKFDVDDIVSMVNKFMSKNVTLNNPLVEIKEMKNEELGEKSAKDFIIVISETINKVKTDSNIVVIVRNNKIVNLSDNKIPYNKSRISKSLDFRLDIDRVVDNIIYPKNLKVEKTEKELIYDLNLNKYIYKIKFNLFNIDEGYSLAEFKYIDALTGKLLEKK